MVRLVREVSGERSLILFSFKLSEVRLASEERSEISLILLGKYT